RDAALLNSPTMSAPVGTTAAVGEPGAAPYSESSTAITGTTPGLLCWSTAAIANIELPLSARAIERGRTVWASLLPAMNAVIWSGAGSAANGVSAHRVSLPPVPLMTVRLVGPGRWNGIWLLVSLAAAMSLWGHSSWNHAR